MSQGRRIEERQKEYDRCTEQILRNIRLEWVIGLVVLLCIGVAGEEH